MDKAEQRRLESPERVCSVWPSGNWWASLGPETGVVLQHTRLGCKGKLSEARMISTTLRPGDIRAPAASEQLKDAWLQT